MYTLELFINILYHGMSISSFSVFLVVYSISLKEGITAKENSISLINKKHFSSFIWRLQRHNIPISANTGEFVLIENIVIFIASHFTFIFYASISFCFLFDFFLTQRSKAVLCSHCEPLSKVRQCVPDATAMAGHKIYIKKIEKQINSYWWNSFWRSSLLLYCVLYFRLIIRNQTFNRHYIRMLLAIKSWNTN